MDKNRFNNLKKQDQLSYINMAIQKTGKTVKEICSEIGIPHNTLSDRFRKMGYGFDRNLKKYISKQNINKIEQKQSPQKGQEQNKNKKGIIPSVEEKTQDNLAMDEISCSNIINKKNRKNTNISFDIDLKKRLQIYGIVHNKNLSDILNEAGELYLKMNDK